MRKQKLIKFLKLGIILFGTPLFLWNCEKTDIDESISEQMLIENKLFRTVSIQESITFFNNRKLKNIQAREEDPIELEPDLSRITQEEILNTEVLITVIPAETKYTNIETRILQVMSLEGEIQSFLFNEIPDPDHISDENFYGVISLTTLDGKFIEGFRVVDGNATSEFVVTSNSLNNDPCNENLDPNSIFCDQYLDEVVIGSGNIVTINSCYNSGPIYNSYMWRYANNGYYSFATGYMNYLNQIAVEEFNQQNVWDTQDPYDDWNKLTDCEKDFFSTNPSFLFNAKANKTRAEGAASERFGNCKNTSGIFSLHNNIGDAYRHAYFSALNAQNSSLGYINAKILGDAHECETPVDQTNEKNMDLHNNNWGYTFSNNNQYFTEEIFYYEFINAYNNGEIIILENCN